VHCRNFNPACLYRKLDAAIMVMSLPRTGTDAGKPNRESQKSKDGAGSGPVRAAPGDFVSRLERCCCLCQRSFGVPPFEPINARRKIEVAGVGRECIEALVAIEAQGRVSADGSCASRLGCATPYHVAFHRPDQLPARYSIAIRVTQAEERRWKCKYLGAQECTLT
jgi:hypothetical protein